jgi:hypothetical protein
MMIEKIKSIKDTVLFMLERFPETRDNDRLLLIYIWCKQNPELKPEAFSFRRFALSFINGDYADPESIRRSRQKIQEEHSFLRGRSYKHRINMLEPEMRAEMITN